MAEEKETPGAIFIDIDFGGEIYSHEGVKYGPGITKVPVGRIHQQLTESVARVNKHPPLPPTDAQSDVVGLEVQAILDAARSDATIIREDAHAEGQALIEAAQARATAIVQAAEETAEKTLYQAQIVLDNAHSSTLAEMTTPSTQGAPVSQGKTRRPSAEP